MALLASSHPTYQQLSDVALQSAVSLSTLERGYFINTAQLRDKWGLSSTEMLSHNALRLVMNGIYTEKHSSSSYVSNFNSLQYQWHPAVIDEDGSMGSIALISAGFTHIFMDVLSPSGWVTTHLTSLVIHLMFQQGRSQVRCSSRHTYFPQESFMTSAITSLLMILSCTLPRIQLVWEMISADLPSAQPQCSLSFIE